MNSKSFTHFMNRIDTFSEELNALKRELREIKEDLEKTRVGDGGELCE